MIKDKAKLKFILCLLSLMALLVATVYLLCHIPMKHTYKNSAGESISVDIEDIGIPIIEYTTDTSLSDLRADKDLSSQGIVKIYDSHGKRMMSDKMYLKGHGNTFADADILKKSWTMRFDNDTSVLGMKAGKKYVALSNTSDPSQLRNKITFEYARDLGMEYTPGAEYALLVINGELQGLYLIAEKIDVGEGRINIDTSAAKETEPKATYIDEDNGTKGYVSKIDEQLETLIEEYYANGGISSKDDSIPEEVVLESILYSDMEIPQIQDQSTDESNPLEEIDNEIESDSSIVSAKLNNHLYNQLSVQLNTLYNTGVLLHEENSPDRFNAMSAAFTLGDSRFVEIQYPEYPGKTLVTTIANRMRLLQSAIDSEDGYATDTDGVRYHYTDLIDIDSYVKKYLIEEISKNRDGNFASSYYYIKNAQANPTIYAGPVWDYDIAYGGYFLNPMYATPQGLVGLLPDLDRRPEFMDLVKQYYKEIIQPYYRQRGLEIIDEQARYIEKAVDLDRSLWGVYGASNAENDAPHPLDMNSIDSWDYRLRLVEEAPSFVSEVQLLKTFLSDRLDYLDDAWLNDQTYYRVNYMAGDSVIHTEWVPENSSIPEYYPSHEDLVKVSGSAGIPEELKVKSFIGWYDEDYETPIDAETVVDDNMVCWGLWE